MFLGAYRQSGQFNMDYANSFPELASMNLTTKTVLAQVTQNKYNFGSVSSEKLQYDPLFSIHPPPTLSILPWESLG